MADAFLTITIAFIMFVLFILSEKTKYGAVTSTIYLFLVFWWAAANLGGLQGTFYVLGILFIMIVIFTGIDKKIFDIPLKTDSDTFSLGRLSVDGVFSQVAFFMLGFVIFLGMVFSQAALPEGATIIGAPQLSISALSTTQLQSLDEVLGPSISGLLGVIENRAFFLFFLVIAGLNPAGWFEQVPFLQMFSGLGDIIISGLITALGFAFFHVKVYDLGIASLFTAFGVMIVWIYVTLAVEDMTPSDSSHWLWNVGITAQEDLGVVI